MVEATSETLMRRLPWILLGTLFLVFDLFVAGFVYARLDPTAADAALHRFNFAQEATSTPTPQRTSTPPSIPAHQTPGNRLFRVQGTSWAVDKWHPRTRVEMGVGAG